MKPEELQAIRERVNNATEGPWRKGYDGVYAQFCMIADVEGTDAEFIAHAREDVPKLLDEIDALQDGARALSIIIEQRDKEIERLRGLFEKLQRVTGQATHFPIEYEWFVQDVVRQALAGDSE